MTTHREMPEKEKTREMPGQKPPGQGQEDREKERRIPYPDRPIDRPERPHPGSERPAEGERPQRPEGEPDRR
jgi:hypothetical protein